MAGQQIVVLGTYAPSLTGFRGDLIAAMIARGHKVTACAPDASPATVDKLRRLGADYRHVPFARNTLGPLADLATLKTLVRLFKSSDPARRRLHDQGGHLRLDRGAPRGRAARPR